MPAYRLTAINRCLKAIGEAPVNSTSSGVPDAESASLAIDEVTAEVLAAGYTCNTSFDVTMTPDQDGIIVIASNILRIDTSGYSGGIAVTVRTDEGDDIAKLYNIKDQTFVFDDPVTCDIVYLFDIDDLPFQLQSYIAARSARVFQESVMGSQSLDAFTHRREAEAWSQLLDYEADQEDSNSLNDSFYMRTITGRNNTLSGR